MSNALSTDKSIVDGFICDESMVVHLQKVFAGEYEFKHTLCEPKSILDIGANAGAFALWANAKWPAATIVAYEPLPENYSLLTQNIVTFKANHNTTTHCEAIGSRNGVAELTLPTNNAGDCSVVFNYPGPTTSVPVKAIAEVGDYFDFVKIDAEGSELEIITAMPFMPKWLTYEYHREAIDIELNAFLSPDYMLWFHHSDIPGLGVRGWIRKTPQTLRVCQPKESK